MYNGWTNRATWLVNLWFEPVTVSDVEYIEETIEAVFLHGIKDIGYTGFYTDMMNFNCINWQELKDACDDEDNETLQAEPDTA
tara:strand:- start:5072 stop:5320 length:249 start_codon:yes stop_codon:yes gene_type:complete